MTALIFATNNPGKVAEAKSLLPAHFDVKSLKEAGIIVDIPEPHDSLEKNALEKSSVIYKLTNANCFSEDTGLEVEVLNGEPGVKSARYAGEVANDGDNIAKLLSRMEGRKNRQARFRTVISLILEGEEIVFEGICDGEIATDIQGSNGFGYDPIFIPTGSKLRFAEMNLPEKNKFSHRKKAMAKLISFLNDRYGASKD